MRQGSVRRWLFGTLASAVALGAFASPAASAAVRTGIINYARPQDPPALTPQTPITQQREYTQSITGSYDDATGAVAVHVQIYDAPTWADTLPYTQIGFALGCSDEESAPEVHAAFRYFARPGFDDADPPSIDARAVLTRSGYAGEIAGTVTPVADGFQIAFPAT